MACCGDSDEEFKKQGMNAQRRCRDVLFLLLFAAFWVGMFIVCGIAFRSGDAKRLVFGVDKYGLTCGAVNTYGGVTVDLTDKPFLYYLNPLELMSAGDIPFAKSVCVAECPGDDAVCAAADLPCSGDSKFVCPYYLKDVAEQGVYDNLSGVDDGDTSYYTALSTYSGSTTDCTTFTVPGGYTTPSCASAAAYGTLMQTSSQFPGRGPCYAVYFATTPYFNRCFPKFDKAAASDVSTGAGAGSAVPADATDEYAKAFNSAGQRWANYVSDISKGILIIVIGGLVGGVAFSAVYMIILRYFAGLMAWATIFLVNAVLIGIMFWAYGQSGLIADGAFGSTVADAFDKYAGDPSSDSQQTWKYIAYAMTAVAGFVLLLTLLMIRRVKIAVACIKVASSAVGAMPSVLLFPILPFIFEVGLIIYWIAVTAVLYTAGERTYTFRTPGSSDDIGFSSLASYGPSAPADDAASAEPAGWADYTDEQKLAFCASSANCRVTYEWNDALKYAFIYHFFGLLWTNQFIVGFGCVVIAGAIAQFYWARGDKFELAALPVVRALKNATIYHLGSVALGSFIVAVIQFIRWGLEYLDRKTKALQEKNAVAKWALCCVKCCMWCLEQIVKFINRNAYIMVAIKGGGYCASAGRAVKLIVTNALRLAVVNVVGDALILLGKVAVAGGCGLIAFAMSNAEYYHDAEKYPDTYLASAVLPIALAVGVGFVVAQIFFAVYEMAVDTILLSFCEDCELHGGEPQFAPPILMDVMNAAYPAPAEGK